MARTYALGVWTLVLLASPTAAQPTQPRRDAHGDPLPDGALLRIGSQRLQTGALIGDLTFSRDGKHIIAASHRTGVFVWDVATGQELHHLPPLPPSRFEIEPPPTDKRFVGRFLSPGGTHVAEVNQRSLLTLREVATGRGIITATGWQDVYARRAQFSPNGKALAVTRFGYEGRIFLYEVASGKVLRAQAGVRLSPGGTHVAEVSPLGVVHLREVGSGREIPFDQKPWEVAGTVAFAPSGNTLAVTDAATSTVHLYEVATGQLLRSQACELASDIIGLARDGGTVTLAALGNKLHWYDASTGKRFVRDATQSEDSFAHGAFSPDGKLLATNSKQHVHLFEVATGKSVTIKGACRDLRFTADGRRLVVLDDPHKGVVKVLEAATGRRVQTSTEGGPVDRIAVSPDGKYLAGADSGDGTILGPAKGAAVRLWHADSGKPLHHFANPRAAHLTVQFAPDGKTITALSHPHYYTQPTACVWDAVSGKPLQRVAWDAGYHRAPGTISADGKVLARSRSDGTLLVTEVATNKILMQAAAVAHKRDWLFLSPDGKFLLAHCTHWPDTRHIYYALQLWDVASGKDMLQTEWRPGGYQHGYLDGSGRILMVVWVPDGKNDPTQVTCYDLATARKLPHGTLTRTTSREAFSAGHYLPMISPDGRLLAVASVYGGPVELRELATGQIVGSLPDRGYVVLSSLAYLYSKNDRVAFSPNGRLLAAATTAGVILVWDVATREVVAEVKAHRGAVASLNWSRDGKRLVSSGQDMTLLVWDAAPWWARLAKAAQPLTPPALQSLWRDLGSDQGKRGYNAVWQLVRAPKQAVTLLRQHLPGAGSKAAAKVRALLADLDSAKFAVREKAYAELEKLGDLALPGLEKALAGSLEVRKRAEKLLQTLDQRPLPAAVLQQMRALKVLETLGTVEAQALLQDLANEDALAWLTREAKLVLARCR